MSGKTGRRTNKRRNVEQVENKIPKIGKTIFMI